MSDAMNMHRCPWIAMTRGETKRPQMIFIAGNYSKQSKQCCFSRQRKGYRYDIPKFSDDGPSVWESPALWSFGWFLGVLISTLACWRKRKRRKSFHLSHPNNCEGMLCMLYMPFPSFPYMRAASKSSSRYQVSVSCFIEVISYTWQFKEVLFVIKFIFVIFRRPRYCRGSS